MPDPERVERTLAALGESRQALLLAQGVHALAAPGQDLVSVALMADVPDQPVVGGVEHVVQRDGQLHGTEAGRQVTAGAAHRLDDELT